MSQPYAGGAPAPRRGLPVWLWIVIAVCSVVIVAIATVTITGYYIVRKFAENPQAMIDKFVTNNPNIEVVSKDDGTGKVVLRDRTSGKTVTIDYEDAKNGRIRFDADGKHVSITTNQRGLEVRDGDKTTRVGAFSSHVPAWVPAYPGSSPQASVVEQEGNETVGHLSFRTRDSFDQVAAYYENALKSAGYTVSRGSDSVSGRTATGDRTVEATLERWGGETKVALRFTERRN